MSDSNTQFEKLTFWQLLAKTSIEIPIIQRDYAQGRKNQQKIRDKFLLALYDALSKESIELDFVYGSEEKESLQPLDGQQRLTTLFLLHWYIAEKEKELSETVKKQLQKFTYETRTSSREFCNELVERSWQISDCEKISESIKNTAWFVASWEKDPTISAMLIMLDSIHAKFKDTSGLWAKLIDEQNPSITFLYVKLKDFGLSDDLYIKMNARGKQLTTFENFKSQLEKYIETNKFEESITYSEDKFAHRIDTIWTDLFWQYHEKQDDNSCIIDTKLINFIAGVAINCYAEKQEIAEDKEEVKRVKNELSEKGKIKNITDEAIKKERIEQRIQQLANNSSLITYEDFWAKDFFQYLVKCFDIYSEKNNDKTRTLKTKFWHAFDDDFLFNDIIASKPTQQERVLFYAQTEYLLNNDNFNQDEFDNWIRVVRNIVENAISGNWNIDLMINLIQLVHRWACNSNNIYSFLSKENPDNYTVAKEQIKEEIEKAKIIVSNPNNKEIIHKTEDTNFCRGKIDFALYCIDYDNTDVFTFDSIRLEQIRNVIIKYLNSNDVSNDFRRAFFTIQNNDFYDYWTTSWLFAVDEPKRKIITDIDDLKVNFVFRGKDNCNISNNNLNYLKELILKLTIDDIDTLISNYISTEEFALLPNWKQRIIKERGLLDHSWAHYIAIKRDNSCCWLIPGSKVANDSSGRKQLKKVE